MSELAIVLRMTINKAAIEAGSHVLLESGLIHEQRAQDEEELNPIVAEILWAAYEAGGSTRTP